MELKTFDKASKEDWIQQIIKDLKGKELGVLAFEDYEGVSFNAYNHSSDLSDLKFVSDPEFKAASAKQFSHGIIVAKQHTNEHVLEMLNLGVNHLFVPYGMDYNGLFKGVNLEFIHVTIFDVPAQGLSVHEKAFFSKALSLHTKEKENNGLVRAANSNTTVIDLSLIYNSGGNTVNQLIGAAIQLSDMLGRGIGEIQVLFGLGANYYFNIAGVRALNKIIRTITKEFGADASQVQVILANTTRELAKNDVNTNLLRLSSQLLSGASTSSNGFLVLDYTLNQNEKSQLLSVNMLNLIEEESYLDGQNDIASGAFFFENITNLLLDKSWNAFTSVASESYETQVQFLEKEVLKSRSKLMDEVLSGNKNCIGVTKFPNGMEDKISVTKIELDHVKPFRIEEVVGV